ncbi:Shr3 amino acid permease chaperone [Trichocladium antarcticum]|uniref:Shr3 amino acid permease chaperone n=1 Tax=Trichocladium antarcticum TaxID=1450529 RepID=A0AAN6UG42_9PEZI|nr:Shr3 amino acid permease chaperone [Trichocladium antarcticum]
MNNQWVDWSKTTRSKDYRGSGSFSTFLIIGPVCFFLGILFASFPYDFPLLWTSDPIAPSYLDNLETHLRFMHQSPPLIARMLHIIVFVGFLGFFTKLFRPSEANILFDGGSLILYVIGAGVYISNIVTGMRAASQPGGLAARHSTITPKIHEGPISGQTVLGREDSLRVLSASHVILALVLVGVLVLQAGQWYAESKEADEWFKMDKEAAERRAAGGGGGGGQGGKKKM